MCFNVRNFFISDDHFREITGLSLAPFLKKRWFKKIVCVQSQFSEMEPVRPKLIHDIYCKFNFFSRISFHLGRAFFQPKDF